MNRPLHARLLLATLLLTGCAPPPPTRVESLVHRRPAEVETSREQREHLTELAGLALDGMTKTMQSLDGAHPGSDINKLNRVGQTVRLQVSRDTYRLLDLAHHYSARTDGAFDPTAAPLEKLWRLPGGPGPAEEPAPELIEGTRQSVGRQHLEIFDQGAIAYTTPGIQVGLNLISPAYATDLAMIDLRRRGFTDLRIQLATTHRVLGRGTKGQPWQVAVMDPFNTNATLGTVRLESPRPALVILPLRNPAIVIGSNTFGNVINPLTGRPAEGTALAAVLGPSATMAHALAQALLVRGVEHASDLLGRFPKCEALLVPDRLPLEVWCSEGFATQLSLSTTPPPTVIPLSRASVTAPDAEPEAPEEQTP